MESTVVQLLESASMRFNSWLKQYRAWHGNNDITESNLTFQLATSFLEAFSDSVAFMEVPFGAPDRKRTDQHLLSQLQNRHTDVTRRAFETPEVDLTNRPLPSFSLQIRDMPEAGLEPARAKPHGV